MVEGRKTEPLLVLLAGLFQEAVVCCGDGSLGGIKSLAAVNTLVVLDSKQAH